MLRGRANRARFEPGSTLEAWLITILRNAFVNDQRWRRREALLLVVASGFGHAEAAAICGVAEGTMKSRVSRARSQLALLTGGPSRQVAAE